MGIGQARRGPLYSATSRSMAKSPKSFWRGLIGRRSLTTFILAAAATVVGGLLVWAMTSPGGESMPTINLSPVQSVRQSVQVAGVVGTTADARAGDREPAVAIVGPDDVLEQELTDATNRALGANLAVLVRGRARITYTLHDSVSVGLRRANVVLDLRLTRPKPGPATSTARLTAQGAGYSEAEARAQAYARLAEQIHTAVAQLR